MRARAVLFLIGMLALTFASAGSAWAAFTPGSPGLGDPFFPLAGNGGYDVSHYGFEPVLRAVDEPALGHRDDHAPRRRRTCRASTSTCAASRSRGSLVDGRAATFTRDGQELVVTPAPGIRPARVHGRRRLRGHADGRDRPRLSIEGWVPTDDGAFVVGEPQGSPGWYPVNDNPRDKATFDFSVTVPAGLTVMANGVLVSHATSGGRTTWVWRETDPMAPYLATATLGRFDLTISTTSGGMPSYVAVDPQLAERARCCGSCRTIVDFYSSIYGPYPFNAVGRDRRPARRSSATRSRRRRSRTSTAMPDEATLAHELSHMWFGDSVTLTEWPDIWLHEGFATWSEWIWSEHQGNKSAQQIFEQLYNTPAHDTCVLDAAAGRSRARRATCSTARSTTAAR